MVWPGSKEAKTFDTGVPAEVLQKAGRGSVEVPTGFVRAFVLKNSARWNWVCGHFFRKSILDYSGTSRVGSRAWTRGKVSIGLLPRYVAFTLENER